MKKQLNSVTRLNNGVEMPIFGLGVFKAKAGDEVYNAVRWAIDEGYTLIDTAAFYFNEKSVGQAVKDSGVDREKLFITTKLWPLAFNDAHSALQNSLRELDMDYVDLYLMHWPGTDDDARLRGWDMMAEDMNAKRIRACSVSNFRTHHLEHLQKHTSIIPACNQIELHPWHQQRDMRAYCDAHGMAVTAWGPMMQGRLKDEPLAAQLGEQYGKSAAQVTLRWHLQHGINIIPKSVKQHRIKENADIFDFELSQADMARIDALNGKGSFALDADLFSGDREAYDKLIAQRAGDR